MLTLLAFPLGISGSLNFDEEESDGEEEEGRKLRSHSPYSEAERPSSASSQKSTTVRSSETSSFGANLTVSHTCLQYLNTATTAEESGSFKDLSSNLDLKVHEFSNFLCLKPALVLSFFSHFHT